MTIEGDKHYDNKPSGNEAWDNKSTPYISSNLYNNMNLLHNHRERLNRENLETQKRIKEQRNNLWYIERKNYPLEVIKSQLQAIVKDLWYDITTKDIIIALIERKQFNADLTIKISSLIWELKWEYRSEFLPKVKEKVQNDGELINIVESVDIVGIYVNIKLKDSYWINTLNTIQKLQNLYGNIDDHKDEDTVMDYSSPNTAKSLHAWHIRSTVLGEVLGNIYQATGYAVHRVNHINDRWGFWVYLYWYTQRADILKEQWLTEHKAMVEIYRLYRLAEKANNSKEFENLSIDDNNTLQKYFWSFTNYEEFLEKFNIFKEETNNAFSDLESGNEEKVKLREDIVNRSTKEFNKFYDELNIHLDYTVWESFYADMWREFIEEWVQKGDILYFDKNKVNKALAELEAKKDSFKKEKDYENIVNEIKNDEDSYVVKLPNFERFVVLKKDWSSIYATRDIWAIKYRINTYNPSQIVYVVWQEQADHFEKLFDSANQMEYSANSIAYKHIAFGFYVDAQTKKKLSSRAWAANVHKLISKSKEYYLEKYKDNTEFTDREKQEISEKLAIWWIVYNDISKSRMSQVLVDSDIDKTIEAFEKRGWVYIVYTLVRAQSVIEKYKEQFGEISVNDIQTIELSDNEIAIIKKLNEFTDTITKAAENDEAYPVAQYLYELSQLFNAFYNASPILKWGESAWVRAYIAQNFIQVLQNGCEICHIPVPHRI